MSANSLKQAVTSATTTVITLASAVTGFNAFTAADDGIEQTYWVFEGNDFQICTGVYTHSGTTLAITNNLQKSVSGVVTNSPATGLTLTSAAEVLLGSNSFTQGQHFQEGVVGTNYFYPHNVQMNQTAGTPGGEFGAATGRIVIRTMLFVCATKITEMGIYISTASSGNNARVAIYRANSDGSPSELVADSGNLSTTSTGVVFGTLATPVTLDANTPYFMADMADNTVVRAHGTRTASQNDGYWGGIQGTATGNNPTTVEECNYYNVTYGAFPATLGTADGTNSFATLGSIYR